MLFKKKKPTKSSVVFIVALIVVTAKQQCVTGLPGVSASAVSNPTFGDFKNAEPTCHVQGNSCFVLQN